MCGIKESRHLLNVYIARGIVPGLEMGGQGDRREMACPCPL